MRLKNKLYECLRACLVPSTDIGKTLAAVHKYVVEKLPAEFRTLMGSGKRLLWCFQMFIVSFRVGTKATFHETKVYLDPFVTKCKACASACGPFAPLANKCFRNPHPLTAFEHYRIVCRYWSHNSTPIRAPEYTVQFLSRGWLLHACQLITWGSTLMALPHTLFLTKHFMMVWILQNSVSMVLRYQNSNFSVIHFFFQFPI